jgi:hypothetical protein
VRRPRHGGHEVVESSLKVRFHLKQLEIHKSRIL